MLRIEKKVGPEFEEDAEEEQLAKQELEELAFEANITLEKEYINKPVVILKLSLQIVVFAGITFGK